MKPALGLKRPAFVAALVLAASAALIGWMHTKSARPFLAAVGIHCPVDDVKLSDAVAIRKKGIASLAGSVPAPSAVAIGGMQLQVSTQSDVRRWVASNRASCETVNHGFVSLRCRGIMAASLGIEGPPISELWFSFGATDKLIGVDIYRRGLDSRGEQSAWSGAVERLKARLGEPTSSFGDASPGNLATAGYTTARVQYRYSDYIATVTAANLPYAGFAVREQYISAGS